jgi:membrane-bound inhibitor of C-type lysozyme
VTHRLALAILTLGLVSAVPAAEDPTQRVRFEPGATSTTLKGTVQGYRSLRYLLGVRAGQVLSISFERSKKTLYYNVTQGARTLHDGAANDVPDWTANVATDGDYAIDIFLKSSDAKKNVEATFTITVVLANATLNYFCTDGRRLLVTYVNDVEPPTARLVAAGKTYELPRVISAGGMQYSDGKVSWTKKGRDGTLELNGPATQCTE